MGKNINAEERCSYCICILKEADWKQKPIPKQFTIVYGFFAFPVDSTIKYKYQMELQSIDSSLGQELL